MAYEKHWDFGNGLTECLGAGSGNDDEAWTIGISYNFMGSLLVGAQYIDMKYEAWPAAGTSRRRTGHLGADWNFGGPHHIMGAYAQAGDSKGSATAAQVALSGLTAGNGAIVAPGSETGGYFWTIQYGYDFSKRTIGRIGYVQGRQRQQCALQPRRAGDCTGGVWPARIRAPSSSTDSIAGSFPT